MRIDGRVAAIAGLVFALHPQNVESVAWIAQRKNLLSLLFGLVALHAYLRFEESNGAGSRRRTAWYAASLLAFALGMLSKGAIALLPGAMLLALAWRRGFGAHAADTPGWRPIRTRDLAAIAPFALVSVALTLQEVVIQSGVIGEEARGETLAARLAGAGFCVWFYAWKTLVPLDLMFVYPRVSIDPGDVGAWIPTAAAAGVWAAAALLWRRGGRLASDARALCFALTWYALMIFPALGFADFYFRRYSFVADHYQYFAQPGLLVPFATLLARAVHRPRALAAVTAVLCIALGALTLRQARAYQDEETLWRESLRKNPDASLALNSLGRLLGQRGELAEALPLFVRAAEVDPTNREAWRNAGLILDMQGEPERALAAFREALHHWPGEEPDSTAEVSLAEAHVRLGRQMARLGQIQAAAHHYRRAAALAPANAHAKLGLGDVALVEGRAGDAGALYREAAVLAPDLPDPLERLTRMYAAYPDPAVRSARLAVELGERAAALSERRDAAVLDALAAAYAEADRFAEAIATAAEAADLAARTGHTDLADEPRARGRGYERGEPHRMERLR